MTVRESISDAPFLSRAPWDSERPKALVIACSDGRLQENVDDFLVEHLGISRYDRLYAPGGPGALAASGVSYSRSDQFRKECGYLVDAHGIEDVYLVFHGPAADGPPEATCGDYRRKLPRATPEEIRHQQEKDYAEILRQGFGWDVEARVHGFRCEITADLRVQFVPLVARGLF